MTKILITDLVYPNKYSRWRNVGIKTFFQHFDTVDVLVFHEGEFNGIKPQLDYNFIQQNHESPLNVIINSKKGSLWGKQNQLPVDKLIEQPNTFPNDATYLIGDSNHFDLNSYDCVYHIFLKNYRQFNKHFNYPPEKQIIHLYPGGGFGDLKRNLKIDPKNHLISTQPFVSEKLEKENYQNLIHAYTGFFFEKNATITPKKIEHPLNVAFSTMGDLKQKGYYQYIQLVEEYSKNYPADKVNFYAFGNSFNHPLIKNHPPMDYKTLCEIYKEKIHLYCNMEQSMAFNGWPLGLEAVFEGAGLLTTDVRNCQKYYQLPPNSLKICHTVEEFKKAIKYFHDHPKELEVSIKNTQDFIYQYAKYENQQERVFQYIQNII